MKTLTLIAALLLAVPGALASSDSCDIAVLPAATLLVPYFEVHVDQPATIARTTIFSVINTSREPQIARATLWSDWGYPVLTFNIFLTGYDVQDINLYDVLVRGVVAPDDGTSSTTRPGSRSASNVTGNPHFLTGAAQSCVANNPRIAPAIREGVLAALTQGILTSCMPSRVGEEHPGVASGYVTLDVVGICSPKGPHDPGYFDEILFDNVLTGDYRTVQPNAQTGNYAAGSPMVHIRAIDKNGDLPYTFYDRYATAGRDRRQPLPSTFAARFIDGSASSFETDLLMWREPLLGGSAMCGDFGRNVAPVAYVVRFDERENATVLGTSPLMTPTAARVPTSSSGFPTLSGSGDVGGWLYLDLDDSSAEGRPSQSWVVTNMSAEGRYSVAVDATALTNGCAVAEARFRPTSNTQNVAASSCDISVQPAATLLLPYFEVEINKPQALAVTTLFTIANVSAHPQIAKVTLWTDHGFPVLTFNTVLTGYDVQSINLYDILAKGVINTEWGTRRPAEHGETNPNFLPTALGECARQPQSLSAAMLDNVRSALTSGSFPLMCGSGAVGGTHEAAVGYATVDLVATCSGTMPTGGWYVNELLFDNVLTGDYEVVRPDPATGNYAGGNPLVHLRAFPEGGKAGEYLPPRFDQTFWTGLTNIDGVKAGADRRQPLPSSFAARYIEGGAGGFVTDLLLWRAPQALAGDCASLAKNAEMPIAEIVRFDERENPAVLTQGSAFGVPNRPTTNATAAVRTSSPLFPALNTGDVGGWMFLNLDNKADAARKSQNWVVVRMFAEGRYSTDSDATPLTNGCVVPAAAQ
ncbi:MAG TPA: hypothetical protein VGF69_14750 [Thermoanaerobaculia bacterium]|jgi:hypothetical protein